MMHEITIPESYEDIKLGDLQKIRALEGDDEFIIIKTIEILTGIRGDKALGMSIKDRDGILDSITEALSFLPTKLIKRFKIGEVEFGIKPDLNNMTYGEFLDLESYGDRLESYHKMMAVLYRPIIKNHKDLYDIEDYQGSGKYSEIMKDTPSNIALSVNVFFCDLGKVLLDNFLKSSKVAELLQRESKKSSLKNGDGTQPQMNLRRAILEGITKSQTLILNAALPKLRTTLISMN